MEKHAGSTVEKVVRRSGISIAELARRIKVNRRSLYNWFEQETLSFEAISKIGAALGYDFSKDFPEFGNHHLFQGKKAVEGSANEELLESISYWKNRYITLLEKYNDLLIKQSVFSEEHAA